MDKSERRSGVPCANQTQRSIVRIIKSSEAVFAVSTRYIVPLNAITVVIIRYDTGWRPPKIQKCPALITEVKLKKFLYLMILRRKHVEQCIGKINKQIL